jgi:Protein of unknown function, DUF488
MSSAVERGTIYTLGYSQAKAAARLEQLMRHPHTLLVDVRYQPVSRWNPQWNRASLAGRYGRRYVWERRLGTIHYVSRDRAVQLAAGHPEAVREAAGLLCAGTSLVLLAPAGMNALAIVVTLPGSFKTSCRLQPGRERCGHERAPEPATPHDVVVVRASGSQECAPARM